MGNTEDSLINHPHQQALQSKLQNHSNKIPQGELLQWSLFPFRLFLVTKDFFFFALKKKITSQKSFLSPETCKIIGKEWRGGNQI